MPLPHPKSKAIVVWLCLNMIFPICVVLLFDLVTLEMATQFRAAIIVFIAIQIGNIVAAKKYTTARWTFVAIIVLNILSLIVAGNISFITALPDWPLVIKSIYMLVMQ